MPTSEDGRGSGNDGSEDGVCKELPWKLLKAELIPPAPNRRDSAVDWLADLGGAPWIAYGAGPLLVVSHLPSPSPCSPPPALSRGEAAVGPFFHQVIELSSATVNVNAVSWCPAIPAQGELAAAAGSCISMYSPLPTSAPALPGSFSWKQTGSIIESFVVEAISWTGSGDGLVAAGVDVVLWARKDRPPEPTIWDLVWRSSPHQLPPQSLLCTNTWSAHGPFTIATAASTTRPTSTPLSGDEHNATINTTVLVYLGGDNGKSKSEFTKLDLHHPQGVSMIQWRPSSASSSSSSCCLERRDILLTCCLDGTARLWAETNNIKPRRKSKKEDRRTTERSFHVIAVIEIDTRLKGILGRDIALKWAVESGGGLVSRGGGGDRYTLLSSSGDSDLQHQVGKCEWLVSTGPGFSVAFWAIHCLDDLSPVRYPRITLWKKQNLTDFKEFKADYDLSKYEDQPILVKAFVSREVHSGPPVMCSLLQLLPDNSLLLSKLYSSSPIMDGVKDEVSSNLRKVGCLSYASFGVLNRDGNTGSIKQVCVHPFSCDNGTQLSASLDSSGVLHFWSFSNLSSIYYSWKVNASSLHPLHNLLGTINLHDVSRDVHVEYSCISWAPSAIDEKRFLLLGSDRRVDCFMVRIPGEGKNLSCEKMFAIQFDVGNSGKAPPDRILTSPLDHPTCRQSILGSSFLVACLWNRSRCKFEQALSWKVVLHCETLDGEGSNVVPLEGKNYSSIIEPCSPILPLTSWDCDQITSAVAVIPPPVMEKYGSSNKEGSYSCSSIYYPSYQMATGYSDGTLKLWKLSSETKKGILSWDLAGNLTACEGPVTEICLSSCGSRIAAASSTGRTGKSSIQIWESVCLTAGGGSGFFLLEEEITLQDPIVGMSWLSLGNGLLLLAVTLPNELRLYCQTRPKHYDPAHSEGSKEAPSWDCFALSKSCHEIKDLIWGTMVTPILVHEKHMSLFSPLLLKKTDDRVNRSLHEKGLYNFLDVLDSAAGPLPFYHPRALMQHFHSGNWKRTQVVLQHLVKYLKTVEKSRSKSCHKFPEISLSDYFTDISSVEFSSNTGLQWGIGGVGASSLQFHSNPFHYMGSSNSGVSIATASFQTTDKMGLTDMLDKYCDISMFNGMEREQILAIADLVTEVSDSTHTSPYNSLDEAGRKFWVAVKYQRLHLARKHGKSLSPEEQQSVDSAMIAWAYQSECQDDLLNSTLSSEPTWSEMRFLGIGFWYTTNIAQLRAKMEKVARSQYLRKKDPKECALLYIALNRIQVLAGLFKISKDDKDKVLFAFLSRNFQEEKNKGAALKNAYVLMGRHQLDLAIAFFLLGGDHSSAITVCAKNYGDPQLALVLCRLIDGCAGGPLEHTLISTILLPISFENRDIWLSSLLEWKLGNFAKSVQRMYVEYHEKPGEDKKVRKWNHIVCEDPQVGQYCVLLSSKNKFRNSVGEMQSVRLSKLSAAFSAGALNRCGLPLEALECVSSSSSSMDSKAEGSNPNNEESKVNLEILSPFFDATCNWLSGGGARDILSNTKLNMASKYLSKLLGSHLPLPLLSGHLVGERSCSNSWDVQIRELTDDLRTRISILEKKFLLNPVHLIKVVSLFALNKGLPFSACLFSQTKLYSGEEENNKSTALCMQLFLKATEEVFYSVARLLVSSGFMESTLNSVKTNRFTFEDDHTVTAYYSGARTLLETSKSVLKHCDLEGADSELGGIFAVLDLLEYIMEFAFTWMKKDVEGLIMMASPVLDVALVTGPSNSSATVRDCLMEVLRKKTNDTSWDEMESYREMLLKQSEDSNLNSISNPVLSIDEKWLIIGACLWVKFSTFAKNYFRDIDSSTNVHSIRVAWSLMNFLECVSSSLTKQFASFIRKKLLKGLNSNAISWLEKSSSQPRSHPTMQTDSLQLQNKESLFDLLWEVSARPQDICMGLEIEKVHLFPCNKRELSGHWKDVQRDTLVDHNNDSETKGNQSDACSDISSYFESPQELIKRSGELLEAICSNSINEQQVAAASNRKGLVFFNCSGHQQHLKGETEYMWSESDWPTDRWAGCESTPVPTHVSEGMGLVGKRGGAHLGLGGATVGLSALAKPGRDITGGGAFGIPGYAGIGAAALGWASHLDSEEFVDPPATANTVRCRALSSHPSRPFLLVGSTNTHVYLWEYGKERALATYGVLPAANVPPPYAVASISAVRFDLYGHRFVTAATDGTVCTWQLEVGGRSNVHPTDSSLCFDTHASDVAYASASGSVVAAAGYSSNNANVVVWDTLAPTATCQSSLLCHEGGARSLSVLDKEIGSGSMSPLIVSGGKNGDVGLHDFRYVATGKAKHPKHAGDSTNGMIWYIPKAHLGSVTRIASIGNTNMFITGSKDGDVKLWDAKRMQQVFQWTRLHDRHTFFQPNSRGFGGGVVRAAVTDIQVLSRGFLSCGGDGSVKLIQLK